MIYPFSRDTRPERLPFTRPFSRRLGDWIADTDTLSLKIGAGPFTTGATLSATLTGLEGGEVVTYRWQYNGVDIAGATSATYTVSIGTDSVPDAAAIRCVATVDGVDVSSGTRQVRYPAGTAPSIPDGQVLTVDEGFSLDAAATGSNLVFTYSLINMLIGVNINASSGLISGASTVTGSDTAQVTATDQYGRTLVYTFTWTSALRSQASDPGLSVESITVDDDAVSIDAAAVDNGNTLTYSLVSTVGNAEINSSTGEITVTGNGGAFAQADVFTGNLVVSALDEYSRETIYNVPVAIDLRPQATAAQAIGPFSFTVDQAITTQDLSVDFTPNGNTLTYSGNGLSTGLSVSSVGEMDGTPTVVEPADDAIVVATDEYGRTTESTFSIAVTEAASITFGTAVYTRNSDGTPPVLEIPDVVSNGLSGGTYTLFIASRDGASGVLSKADIENNTGNAVEAFQVGPQADITDLDQINLDLSSSMSSDAFDFFYRHSGGEESAVGTVTGVNYDAGAPAFSSASVDAAGTTLTFNFDKDTWKNGTLLPADFVVEVGGAPVSVSAAALTDGTTSGTLTLASPVLLGDVVTLSLADGIALVGIDFEYVSTFTDEAVTNNSTVTAGSSLDVTYLGETQVTPGGTTATFADQSLGDEDASREIFVAVSAYTAEFTEVTVGGVASTASWSSPSDTTANCAIFRVPVPTGTVGDIVVTMDASPPQEVTIRTFRATDVSAITDTVQTNTNSPSSPLAMDIDVADGGAVIAVTQERGAGSGFGFSGIAQVGTDIDNNTADNSACGMSSGLSAEAPRSVGVTFSGTPGEIAIAAISLE